MSSYLESKDLFLGETFANLRFVRFGCHLRLATSLLNVHLRQYLLGVGEYLQFDLPRWRLLGRTELSAAVQDCHHEARRRAYTGAMHVIASIILLALIVGGLILARRLRSLLDISAASPLLGPSLP